MDNTLKFKSKVIKIYDYKKTDISSFVPEFSADENKIKKDIERYRIKNGTKTEASEIALGDMVTLSCKSDNPKFSKENIVVSIGKGLFCKELEESIIGLGVGERKIVTINSIPVYIVVAKITRTILADIDEGEMANIRKKCIDKQLDMFFDEGEAVDNASAYVCTVVAEKSEFDLDQNEIYQVTSSIKQKLGDNDESYQMFKNIFINTFKNAVTGYCYAEKNNALITIDDYEKFIDKCLEYETDKTKEEMKIYEPLFDFAQTRYADYYIKMIDEYIKNTFKNIINP